MANEVTFHKGTEAIFNSKSSYTKGGIYLASDSNKLSYSNTGVGLSSISGYNFHSDNEQPNPRNCTEELDVGSSGGVHLYAKSYPQVCKLTFEFPLLNGNYVVSPLISSSQSSVNVSYPISVAMNSTAYYDLVTSNKLNVSTSFVVPTNSDYNYTQIITDSFPMFFVDKSGVSVGENLYNHEKYPSVTKNTTGVTIDLSKTYYSYVAPVRLLVQCRQYGGISYRFLNSDFQTMDDTKSVIPHKVSLYYKAL